MDEKMLLKAQSKRPRVLSQHFPASLKGKWEGKKHDEL